MWRIHAISHIWLTGPIRWILFVWFHVWSLCAHLWTFVLLKDFNVKFLFRMCLIIQKSATLLSSILFRWLTSCVKTFSQWCYPAIILFLVVFMKIRLSLYLRHRKFVRHLILGVWLHYSWLGFCCAKTYVKALLMVYWFYYFFIEDAIFVMPFFRPFTKATFSLAFALWFFIFW